MAEESFGWTSSGSGGGGNLSIVIPTPQIKIRQSGYIKIAPMQPLIFFKGQIFAQYLPTNDTTWQNYEPKYYLFRHRDTQSTKWQGVKRVRKAGWFHPTNLDGLTPPIGGRVYAGITNGNILSTEYSMLVDGSVIKPYSQLAINVNPFEWTQYFNSVLGVWQRMNEDGSDFGLSIYNYRITGKRGSNRPIPTEQPPFSRYPLSNTFVLAIGIKNPDTTDLSNPILFGDFSEQFRLRIQAYKDTTDPLAIKKGIHFHWDIQMSSVPLKRFII